jgi:hypothetical protein
VGVIAPKNVPERASGTASWPWPTNRPISRFSLLTLRGEDTIDRKAPMREVVAMPIHSSLNHGVFFEPDGIALMSEAFEAACQVFHDADRSQGDARNLSPDELLQRRHLVSVTRFACALPHLQGDGRE